MGDNNQRRRALSDINPNILEVARKPFVINKRDYQIQGKDVCENSSVLPHRPLTRTFAAQIVQNCSNQERDQETKDLLRLIGENSEEDCEILDLENSGEVPFFVKHTAAILDEVDEVEEVEMEDVDEEEDEPVIDIDDGNLKDPLFVVEYVNDIYDHYRKTERLSCVSSNYMIHQPEINEKMRAILIDWLIEVHHRFELMEETLFLTVNLIDRFLERRIVTRKKLQLVGVTAMLLACKYEEVYAPVVDDFVIITDKAYAKNDVLDMERVIVNTLQFKLSVPTPFVFIKRFLKTAPFDKMIELLSHFIIELCLVEDQMLKFSPSLLAAAAIYTAQCSVCRSNQWSKTSEWYTNYTQHQLLECSRMMVVFHQNAGKNKLTGVYTKYNTSKFGFAAKAKPADFLLLSF